MGKGDPGVDILVAKVPLPVRGIVVWLRDLVVDTAPDLEETVKWGNPCYVGRDNVLYLAAAAKYVQFGFFKGARLQDPAGLLEGTGKGLRHVKVRAVDPTREPALRALVEEAVALDRRA